MRPRSTRVTNERLSAIAKNPEHYDGLEVIKALFPARYPEWVKSAKESKREWVQNHCITGLGFSDNFTDQLTGDEHTYSFSCGKGVVKVIKFDKKETQRSKKAHEMFLKEQAAKPWITCPRCNEPKEHFCRSGGCMDCAVSKGIPSFAERLTHGPVLAMARFDAGIAGEA